ncbi:MAG: NAD(P)-dependent oxidoreductase [Candidatus Dactylopiibacterium carminicum]|uniref:NAD(P)-dependent oxidoreductase n=1 Tax=Candidatus Dactylopiibacterium carminicum TaxID=857335 RepID=A0A272EP82_9RHOO|nr:NAD(P)H-binding protein [Candidatus Dactylopiibacterium carminicum]KAF7598214.1 NAD(P)-dependent oxidoreductase [Candidatus Dactylopiibacterium carminicum]PAS91866.1 MAG: NAD(P)-dependent oxidoreductase [Candidatus Dactylopiibacterium carminicum]PAS94841.1 MAG: NAD(P)-dependent oxidoreductase [Candidatus Dactylopiibacterium carminicum]PAS97009.1 MAG: NAD(P)-dependent oxidoreductase [Candidatus Dactylopiibacterium carminicum]
MNRLLIVGCGDVLTRALPWLCQRFQVYALARGAEAAARLRVLGVRPVAGDLDDPASLARLAGLAEWVLHAAPPPGQGEDDPRMRALLAVLVRRAPRRIVYVGTSGVYGDCGGAVVTETRPLRASTARAKRRVAAELRLRAFALSSGCALRVLRVPGIYAADRLSLARLQRGDPVLRREEDVFTNHVHAEDLARAAALALFRGPRLRSFNLCDDSCLAMGDYFEAMADIFGLPRPPRMSRAECLKRLSPAMASFMGESRRLDNTRAKRELRLRLSYPEVLAGLRAARDAHPDKE